MIQATHSPSRRAERAAVRELAGRVDAARVVVGGCLLRAGGAAPFDDAVGSVLAGLWSERFSGRLEPDGLVAALEALGVKGSARTLEPVLALLGEPCTPLLAARLGQAHELTLRRRLRARGRGVVLEASDDRRSQGAYYTPPDVVAFIVEETLGGLLGPWEDELATATVRRCGTILRRARALKVLDPACGGGAFLLGALARLRAFYVRLAERIQALGGKRPAALEAPGRLALRESLRGVDIDRQALALAELALLAAVADEPSAAEEPLVGTTLREGDHLALDWQRRAFGPVFSRKNPGFDVVLGNPPYAPLQAEQRAAAQDAGFASADCSDVYVLFVEALERTTRRGGRAGLIVPLSLVFSRRARSLREQVILGSRRRWRLASFDRIPSGLFEATVRTRTTIVLVSDRCTPARVETSCLQRFTAAQRPRVFEDLAFFDAHGLCREDLGFPKLGSSLQAEWLRRFQASAECLGDGLLRAATHRLYYKQNCYGFAIVAAELPPAFGPSDEATPQTKYSSLGFPTLAERDVALATVAGRWLFWWWMVYGDGFDVTGKLIAAFPVDPRAFSASAREGLATIGRELRRRMPRHVAYKRNGGKRIGTFDLRECRELTDRADAIVSRELGADALLADVRAFLARTHGVG